MAADELSPISVVDDPSQPTSSAFSSPARNETPLWREGPTSTEGKNTATDTQEGPPETRAQAKICPGSPEVLSSLPFETHTLSPAPPTCGGSGSPDIADAGEAVIDPQRSGEPQIVSLTHVAPIVHRSSPLVTESSEEEPRRGAEEEEEIYTPTGYLTPTGGEREPAALLLGTEEEDVDGGAVRVEITTATKDEESEGSEGAESEYDDPASDGVSDSAADGRGDVGEESGDAVLCTRSGDSETDKREMTPQADGPTASAVNKGVDLAPATLSGSAGGGMGRDSPSQERGGAAIVEVGEPHPQGLADSGALEKNAVASSCPLGKEEIDPPSQGQRQEGGAQESRPAVTSAAAAAAAAGAAAAGFRHQSEIDSDDDPGSILIENSFIDSDDGTATSSRSTGGRSSGDKLPISPQPWFSSAPQASSLPGTDTVSRGGGGGGSMYPNGTTFEAGITQFSPSLKLGPVPSSGITEASNGGGGMTQQEWRAGISPLMSPAVAGGPSGDSVTGFGCSETTAAVVSPRGIASVSQGKQELSMLMDDAGEQERSGIS